MIVMLDTPQNLDECERELGLSVEQLFTPLTRRNPQRPEQCFAMDNGAFSKFEPDGFMRMLEKHSPRIDLCRWVAVPDIPGSAIRTLEAFHHWYHQLTGWPLAYVAQDGQETTPIPWDKCAAVFIGGTTAWKVGPHAESVLRACKVMGKWCHVGRVNTPGRLEHFTRLGADSCDGTGLAKFSEMREAIFSRMKSPMLNLNGETEP